MHLVSSHTESVPKDHVSVTYNFSIRKRTKGKFLSLQVLIRVPALAELSSRCDCVIVLAVTHET
jgi:hypothetical protein